MRKILISIICVLIFSSNAYAKTDVKSIEEYLNNLKSIQAEFKQTAYDGSHVNGTFYLKRPGKLRFEYEAPIKDFIVADGLNIYFYDSEMEQQSHTGIGNTLADFLLRDDLKLSGDVEIITKGEQNGFYYVTIAQKDNLEAGKMSLIFAIKPKLELKKWIIFDSQGFTTEVELSELKNNVKHDKKLFYYRDPNKDKQRFN